MKPKLLLFTAALALLTACGDDKKSDATGARCDVAGDCAAGLQCFSEFFKERKVCTLACDASTECPDGTVCVEGISSYRSQPLSGYCVRPCVSADDCEAGGSVCDSHESIADNARYCF